MINKKEVTGFLSFFKFPKPFIYDEKYKSLSNNAKIMYMFLFDRLELSIKNHWHDKEGNVFQYYTNEQLQIDLNSSEKTIIKLKKELKNAGLLKEIRQGNNLPNRIYISALSGAVENAVPELEKLQYGTEKNTVPELKKLQTIKTNNTKTNNTKTDNILSICREAISYLNEKCHKNYRVDTATHHKHIKARLKEGYKLEDFKKVVDIMSANWLGTKYEPGLRPGKLFGTSIDDYLNYQMPKRFQSDNEKIDERLGF